MSGKIKITAPNIWNECSIAPRVPGINFFSSQIFWNPGKVPDTAVILKMGKKSVKNVSAK